MTEISTSLEIFNSGLRPNILKFQHIMTQLIEISTIHQDQSHSNFNSAFPLLFCKFPKPGEFVAFVHAAWRSRPLIGQVETVSRNKVHIRWWDGSYSTTWKPSKKRTGRQTVPWMEDIPKVDIVLTFLWKHKEGNSQDSQ